MHVPRAVAEAGVTAARQQQADGLVAVGGGAAIGLAKAIALQLGLPILAVPTTYSGSEATPIYGTTDGERKITGRDSQGAAAHHRLRSRSHARPAAGRERRERHERDRPLRRGAVGPRADAGHHGARGRCHRSASAPICRARSPTARTARRAPIASSRAWLAGVVLTAGTALHHKLAHVLGGLGLPHAETHAIILPHVTRFNVEGDADARRRLNGALACDDPGDRLERMKRGFPIPQRLR